jgi:hypothetical protein
VYSFDFSNVTTPGVYRVFVPDLGVSHSFVIANDVLDYAAYTTGRGLFYQRCGYHLGHVYPYADASYQREPCHESPLSMHSAQQFADYTFNATAARLLQQRGLDVLDMTVVVRMGCVFASLSPHHVVAPCLTGVCTCVGLRLHMRACVCVWIAMHAYSWPIVYGLQCMLIHGPSCMDCNACLFMARRLCQLPWTSTLAKRDLQSSNVTVDVEVSSGQPLGGLLSVVSDPDGTTVRVVGTQLTQAVRGWIPSAGVVAGRIPRKPWVPCYCPSLPGCSLLCSYCSVCVHWGTFPCPAPPCSPQVLERGVLDLGNGAGLAGPLNSGSAFTSVLPSNDSETQGGVDPNLFEAAPGITDAIFHPSLLSSSLYNGERILGWKDVHGGHHDAGDYGTYTYPLTYTLQQLLTAYDIAPDKASVAVWCRSCLVAEAATYGLVPDEAVMGGPCVQGMLFGLFELSSTVCVIVGAVLVLFAENCGCTAGSSSRTTCGTSPSRAMESPTCWTR